MPADAPLPSAGALDAQTDMPSENSGGPTADLFFSTAHLLHSIARVMESDSDLLELAVSHYQAALDLNPQAVWRNHALGLAQASLGRWEEAIASYQAALQQRPEDAVLLTDLGHALHRVKKTEQSVASYHAAIGLDGCSMRAHTELGLIFMEGEKWQDAVAEFNRVSECHPVSPLVSYHWGLALEQQGRRQDAMKIWEPFLVSDTSRLAPREKGMAEKIREKVTSLSPGSQETSSVVSQ